MTMCGTDSGNSFPIHMAKEGTNKTVFEVYPSADIPADTKLMFSFTWRI
jgi:hypothetical protein